MAEGKITMDKMYSLITGSGSGTRGPGEDRLAVSLLYPMLIHYDSSRFLYAFFFIGLVIFGATI